MIFRWGTGGVIKQEIAEVTDKMVATLSERTQCAVVLARGSRTSECDLRSRQQRRSGRGVGDGIPEKARRFVEGGEFGPLMTRACVILATVVLAAMLLGCGRADPAATGGSNAGHRGYGGSHAGHRGDDGTSEGTGNSGCSVPCHQRGVLDLQLRLADRYADRVLAWRRPKRGNSAGWNSTTTS